MNMEGPKSAKCAKSKATLVKSSILGHIYFQIIFNILIGHTEKGMNSEAVIWNGSIKKSNFQVFTDLIQYIFEMIKQEKKKCSLCRGPLV